MGNGRETGQGLPVHPHGQWRYHPRDSSFEACKWPILQEELILAARMAIKYLVLTNHSMPLSRRFSAFAHRYATARWLRGMLAVPKSATLTPQTLLLMGIRLTTPESRFGMRAKALLAAATAYGVVALLTSRSASSQDAAAPENAAPATVEAERGASDLMRQLIDWTATAYDREPQLVTAIVVMVGGLTALALIALLYTAVRRGLELLRRKVKRPPEPIPQRVYVSTPKRTVPALEIVDDGATALPVRGNMVRIGRHEENDICLSSKSVHRYHAVMHLTDEQRYIITDISGLDGNGVFVNAERIENTLLQNGDLIELGDVKLRFRLNELH